MISFLVTIVLTLLVVGVLVWGIKAAPVIDPTFKQFAVIVIIVGSVIWLVYRLVPLLHGFHAL